MADPIVFGPSFSTYVRSARLALEEKGIAYRLEEFNFLEGLPAGYREQRQPFGKVPAFEHDGLSLHETVAIMRYVDEAFDGPALQPASPAGRARMTQVSSVIDAHGYGPLIGSVVIQRMVVPMQGGTPDEAAIAAAMPAAELVVDVLDGFLDGDWLAGDALSLADLHLVPIYAYFSGTPEGERLLGAKPRLGAWWERVSARPSVAATAPNFG